MGDREQPLDQRQPAVEVLGYVRVGEIQVHGLLILGRGVAVIHQRHIDADTVREAPELLVPLKPPAGVALAKDDQQERW